MSENSINFKKKGVFLLKSRILCGKNSVSFDDHVLVTKIVKNNSKIIKNFEDHFKYITI